MRVLGRVRLSKSSDASTSVERQREIIENWAAMHGHTIVGWAEDVDVSGSISPFEAPALGPWLREPRSRDWDVLVAWKLDRVARTSVPLHRLFGWIQDNDKTLVCVADNIDLSTWVGRLIASVIAGVAEGELEAIRERQVSSKSKLRKSGRWAGGVPPYGWRPAKRDGGGYELEHDPGAMPVLQRIIQEFIDGKPARIIAEELAAEGITPPRMHLTGNAGGNWSGTSIRRMLGSKALLGWTTHQGVPLLNEEGKPILKGPPAVDQETFGEIQAVLAGKKWAKVIPDKTSPLFGVLKCWHCDKNMSRQKNRNKATGSYVCSGGCKQIGVNTDLAEDLVEEYFRVVMSDVPVKEKRITYASDVSNELAEARAAYDDVAAFLPSAPTAEMRQILFSQLETIGKRVAALEAQEATEDTVEWVESGQTYGQMWGTMDTEQRRQLLIRSGITFRIKMLSKGTRWGYGNYQAHVHLPMALGERAEKLSSTEIVDGSLPAEVRHELDRIDQGGETERGARVLPRAE